jgi:hypothetical protein
MGKMKHLGVLRQEISFMAFRWENERGAVEGNWAEDLPPAKLPIPGIWKYL